jgi:seryl-tRNA synthetase
VIDLKLLRASPGQVRGALARRGDASLTRLLDEIEALDMKRRTLTAQLDTLKAERNDAAKADALAAKQGGLSTQVLAERKKLGERIAGLESELRQIETTLEAKALFVPNLPLPDVPDEQTALRSWGTPAPKGGKPHWEIAETLGILDLPAGAKLAGSGFPVLKGMGARLARALINRARSSHTRVRLVRRAAASGAVRGQGGTGQLPASADDAHRTTDDLVLIPRRKEAHESECDEITTRPLTLEYVAYTPFFRRKRAPRAKTRGDCCASTFDKVELALSYAATPGENQESLGMRRKCCASVAARGRSARERFRVCGGQDVRSRSVGARRGTVARGVELQLVHRLSGPARQHSVPPQAR